MTDFLRLIASGDDGLPDKPVRAVGIDLGTTNSAVAEIVWDSLSDDPPKPECMEIEQPTRLGPYLNRMAPSVVSVLDDQVWVGEGAKRMLSEEGAAEGRNVFHNSKNDMGVRRTYHQAPDGFRSAKEIAGHILAFLENAALDDNEIPIDQFTITVPASFQMAQRADTVEAATLAGIEFSGGDLLDEPVAALVDYLASHGDQISTDGNMLVFDFGGGTCDIAVFRVSSGEEGGLPDISELAVSRYHRLGGGDIDTSIVHRILIPQLIEQNDADENDLTFEDRKLRIEPQLIGIAESLKIGLCEEIQRLEDFGRYRDEDRDTVTQTQPGGISFDLPEAGKLTLIDPTLSAAQLDQVLEPFLDLDLMRPIETEYELACSIFAPIADALDRARIEVPDVNYCLLVGGSVLIPQVRAAIGEFLSSARLLRHDEYDDTQLAVARGAAYNALSLALRGRPIIRAIAPDAVSVQTSTDPVTLIPHGEELPYPADGFGEIRSLATPVATIADPYDLRFEILGGDAVIYSETWQVPPMVDQGTPLLLKYQYDENKVLRLELGLAVESLFSYEPFQSTIQNPLSNVLNPSETQNEIIELEEELRTGARRMSREQVADKLDELAEKYSEIGQIDKAISSLRRALRIATGEMSASAIMNRLGILYGQKGDLQRQERMYLNSADESRSSAAPLFNLALAQDRMGRLNDAADTIESALERRDDGPTRTLSARIYARLGENGDSEDALDRAFGLFNPLPLMSEWELEWYRTAARMRRDESALREYRDETERRRRAGVAPVAGGELPVNAGDDA